MKTIVWLALALFFAMNAHGSELGGSPRYTVIKKEVNAYKNDVYYRVSLEANGSVPTAKEIEKVCNALDSEGRRKFSAAIYLKGMNTNDAAYATCGRLPGEHGKPKIEVVGELPSLELKCASAKGGEASAVVKAVPYENFYQLHVVFKGKRPSLEEVDRVLRGCMLVAAEQYGGKYGPRDIIGSSSFRKRSAGSANDDEPLNPYGGLSYLSYEASSKSIVVSK